MNFQFQFILFINLTVSYILKKSLINYIVIVGIKTLQHDIHY